MPEDDVSPQTLKGFLRMPSQFSVKGSLPLLLLDLRFDRQRGREWLGERRGQQGLTSRSFLFH